MCVMGLVLPGQEFTSRHIEEIYWKGNNDGYGGAWVEGERNDQGKLVRPGRIKTVKSIGFFSEYEKLYEEQLERKVPFLFHLRNATAGEKMIPNCHPYTVLDMDLGDPIDLVMFHNGTIRNAWIKKEWSDSRNFAEIHLRGLLRKRPSMLYEKEFRFFLAGMIENNKLMFLDNRERVSIINYEMGSIHPSTGVWLSTKEDIKKYRSYQDRQTSASSEKKVETSSSAETPVSRISRVTWNQPDGSTWVMSSDGRSHFMPKVDKTEKSDDAPDINELIEKAKVPQNVEEFENLKKQLSTGSFMDIYLYVQEYPVESAYLMKYIAGMYPEAEGSDVWDREIPDLIVYCLETAWQAAYGLEMGVKTETKERAHEVN